jgi:hypothetical protein
MDSSKRKFYLHANYSGRFSGCEAKARDLYYFHCAAHVLKVYILSFFRSDKYIYYFLVGDHKAANCKHSIDERKLSGCWTTPEVHLAIQNGYKVLKYHEIWHYDNMGPSLFRDFLLDLKRLKFINSGFPDNVPEEGRQKWLNMMIAKEVSV